MGEIYNPGQVSVLFKHITKDPGWFILGGPADGDEAQVFHAHYPTIQIIGIEPCKLMYDIQIQRGFPGTLLNVGLSDQEGVGILRQNGRMSSMVRDTRGSEEEIPLTTLDALSEEHGPFTDAILWLDIEGMEYRALLGAKRLLHRKDIFLLNLEFMDDVGTGMQIDRLLTEAGFTFVQAWRYGANPKRDRIYRRR